jgi:hypothetical protein
MRLTAVTIRTPDGALSSALTTNSAIDSYSSNLWEMLCPLYAAARFPLSLNALYEGFSQSIFW